MAKEIINLDRLIAEIIHRPRIEGCPLYARVDNLMETGNDAISKEKGEKWDRASKVSYNSPGNIRKIFITYKGASIQLYTPIVGDRGKSLTHRLDFPVSLDKVLMSMNGCGNLDKEYRVKGYGLTSLYKPWVCSNIEEVYFDWSMFISEDILNMGMGNIFAGYTGARSSKLLSHEPIKNIFDYSCVRNINNVRDRFPRLRCIGYISNLEDICREYIIKGGRESIEDKIKLWCDNELVLNSIRDINESVSIYKLDDIKIWDAKFSVKEGIYKFDRDVLRGYSLELGDRIRENLSKRMNESKNASSNSNNKKSKIEIALDNIRDDQGITVAKISFKAITYGMSREDIGSIVSDMSEEGREAYSEFFR